MYGSTNHALNCSESGPHMRLSPQSAKKDFMSFSFPALYAWTSRYWITDTYTTLLFSNSVASAD